MVIITNPTEINAIGSTKIPKLFLKLNNDLYLQTLLRKPTYHLNLCLNKGMNPEGATVKARGAVRG